MRALVINADDFGLTPGVNAGVLDAHRDGALTSASLMATADAAGDAIAIARETPTLGVGCHLTLVDGRPALPSSALPTLAIDGRFRPTWGAFISACAARRISMLEIERELTRQIEQLIAAGLTLTHLDSHKHVHLYPPIFAIVARLAVRFRIQSVRVPFEHPAFDLILRHRRDRQACRQAGENLLMAPWASGASRRLARHALPPAPRFVGRALTGRWSVAALADIIGRLPHGVSELMAHPGYPDDALALLRTRLRAERADEVATLRSPLVRQCLDREDVRLVRHGAVVPA
ncbi:MAG TPA: ChbG/HpnK family deacetylase [Vicinamibacterales bacterium]